MDRRAWFRRVIGAVVAAPLAPHVPRIAAWLRPAIGAGTYGGISRATYSFWRSRQTTLDPAKFRLLQELMGKPTPEWYR